MRNFSHYYIIGTFCFLSIFTLVLSHSPNVHATPIGHAPWVGETLKGAPCRGGAENFGPFDYLQRHNLPKKLSIVEHYHFNPQVEQLIKGQTGSIFGDIDYTLKAWPNHHRALNSTIQFQMIHKNKKTGYPPAECYLGRAIKFSPKDGITRMLYGNLLQRTGHKKRALKQYEQALELKPTNVQIKYNLALLLVDLGKYDRARKYALALYSKGFPLPGLKNKLRKAGHWNKADDNKKMTESGGVPEVQ